MTSMRDRVLDAGDAAAIRRAWMLHSGEWRRRQSKGRLQVPPPDSEGRPDDPILFEARADTIDGAPVTRIMGSWRGTSVLVDTWAGRVWF
jgi:hypothetical protein